METVSSPLTGLFEKRRAKKFSEYVQNHKLDDPSTHQGMYVRTIPMEAMCKYFGLEDGTTDSIGHALALHLDDETISASQLLDPPSLEIFDRITLLISAMARLGKYPYPVYGLGELPKGLSVIYGGTIYGGTNMLDKKVDEIVYENGKIISVRSGEEIAKCSHVICRSPASSVPSSSFLDHSFLLIIPQNQVKRKHNISIAVASTSHNVCDMDHYLAIVSTTIEADNPQKIQPGLALPGLSLTSSSKLPTFASPINEDHVYVSKSYDATLHFETVCDDVKDLYKSITGNKLVLKQRAGAEETVQTTRISHYTNKNFTCMHPLLLRTPV